MSIDDITDPNNISYDGPKSMNQSVISLNQTAEEAAMIKLNDSYDL